MQKFRNTRVTLIIALHVFSCILLTGCDSNDSGIIRVNNSGNFPPSIPSNPVPADNATISPGLHVELQWVCTDNDVGDTLRYDVYLDNVNPPGMQVASNILLRVYDFGIPGPDTYFWKIIAKDKLGATSTGPVWRFTVSPP